VFFRGGKKPDSRIFLQYQRDEGKETQAFSIGVLAFETSVADFLVDKHISAVLVKNPQEESYS